MTAHFLAVARFTSKAGSNHDWDFAVIDSQNKAECMDFVKEAILERTTLANPIDSTDHSTPREADENSRWKFINTVRQTGTECGSRTALHLYIAAHSKDMADFECKINELGAVAADEPLCPKARSWAEELRAGSFDEHLQEYEWLKAIIVDPDDD